MSSTNEDGVGIMNADERKLNYVTLLRFPAEDPKTAKIQSRHPPVFGMVF